MSPLPASRLRRVFDQFWDGLLIVLIVAAAFLLGCQELFDSDVWWHVRSGQWIWANGRVPDRDPFTFTSSDRPWIDLHWLFQLILAGAHGIGGAARNDRAGCVDVRGGDPGWRERSRSALAAGRGRGVLAARTGRDECAIQSGPEAFSLLAVAAYLSVLVRADRKPEALWLLPLVQVIWVNTHALFVSGTRSSWVRI